MCWPEKEKKRKTWYHSDITKYLSSCKHFTVLLKFIHTLIQQKRKH